MDEQQALLATSLIETPLRLGNFSTIKIFPSELRRYNEAVDFRGGTKSFMTINFKGIAYVITAAACFGILPILSVNAYHAGINVITLLAIRFSIAALFFFAFVLAGPGKPAVKLKKLLLKPKNLLQLFILGGICYTLQASFYVSSVNYIPASLAVLLLYTYPVFVALISLFSSKEKIPVRMFLTIMLALAGLGLVFLNSFGRVRLAGVFLALGASVVQSCYNVLANRVLKDIEPVAASAFISLFAGFSLWIAGFATGNIHFAYRNSVWVYIAGIVVISTVAAILTYLKGIQLLGPVKASLISMAEPLFTVFFSVLLINERLYWIQLIGGAIVILASILAVKTQKKKDIPAKGAAEAHQG